MDTRKTLVSLKNIFIGASDKEFFIGSDAVMINGGRFEIQGNNRPAWSRRIIDVTVEDSKELSWNMAIEQKAKEIIESLLNSTYKSISTNELADKSQSLYIFNHKTELYIIPVYEWTWQVSQKIDSFSNLLDDGWTVLPALIAGGPYDKGQKFLIVFKPVWKKDAIEDTENSEEEEESWDDNHDTSFVSSSNDDDGENW